VQKAGATFVAKRIADYVMAPPKPRDDEEVEAESDLDLDGQMIEDDDGQPLGLANRLDQIAVYVVGSRRANHQATLQQCLDDPNSRVFFQHQDGRLVGLIYVPDPSQSRPSGDAIRADEI